MQIQKIISFIDENTVELAVLLCHHNADPDAICAAFALSRLLERLRPELEIEIAASQGVSNLSKLLLDLLPVRLTVRPRIEEADLIILLDTNTTQQLDEWGERVKASHASLIVVDHHASHPETEKLATLYIADEEASATCEIIYSFFKEAGIEIKEVEAKALFLGIAFDTRHFILAKSNTFKIVSDLVDSGVKVEQSLPLLSKPIDPSERIARLRACQRAKIIKIKGWLIALSHVSSYQASAARALIGLGSHVAIVAGQKEHAIRVSLRSSLDFHKITGIHLGRDIAKPLGEFLNGMGGGHSVSAGANGGGNIKATLKCCLELLKQRLSVK